MAERLITPQTEHALYLLRNGYALGPKLADALTDYIEAQQAEVERLTKQIAASQEWIDRFMSAAAQAEGSLLLARAEVERYRDSLPPPDKLELLAEWIDRKYPNDSNPLVQNDLRQWATDIRGVLDLPTPKGG